jgi:hypothetical protein
MNKFLTLLACVFLLSKAASAQSIVTFKSLGHNDDAIYGVSGSSSTYVKIPPTAEVNGSKLVVYIEPSQALIKEHSYVNVLLNDKPVYSGHLTKDSIQAITLKLSAEDISPDKFLKIQVKTLLTITDDICRDLDNAALWLKVKDNSYLSLVKNTKTGINNVNISNSFESKRAIVYPADPSLYDLKAVAWAYARLRKVQNKKILIFEQGQLPDSIKDYVMVGKIDAIPADKRGLIKVAPDASKGLLYLDKSMTTASDTVTKMVNVKGTMVAYKSVSTETVPAEVLFVTGGDDAGYDKAITALGNTNILNSSFGNYLLVDHADNNFAKHNDENRSKLTFRQIGGTSDFLSGIGSLKSVYSFKNSDFTFTPKETEIKFIGTYSGLAPGDRGYFNVYLNGQLISSEKLDASGKLNSTITINRYQQHKYNTLESEFRFFPSSGACKNSFLNFFGEVDVDKSYLESKNPFISSDLSFFQYPEAFNNGITKIVVSKGDAKYAAGAIGEIIFELNNNINANNFPDFVYSSTISDGDLSKYNIIALLAKNDPLLNKFKDAPIKFSENFRLYNTDNNKAVYSVADTVSTGLAQIFYGGGDNATLILTATGSDLSDAFLTASKSITEQLSTLSSNVSVSDINSNKYLFNINKTSDNLEYVDTKTLFLNFWDSYNLYILVGILVLILLAFLFVRSRVQNSQEIFATE